MSHKLLPAAGALLLAALLAPAAVACLWDSDTLQMERLRFPGVLEIITGKFVRHSRAYYEWRIKDRLKKLEKQPGDPALIDDLAVGYDKLGRYDEGIAILEKSLAADPDRYETLANLATLLFHAGRLEESKQHVQRALEVNPDAHFGREKYQLLLTDYVLQSNYATSGVICLDSRSPHGEPVGFAKFVLVETYGERAAGSSRGGWQDIDDDERNAELHKAGKGVLGMMHFANYESPVLLEAIGDLLMTGQVDANGTQLAARAYLRAAQGSQNPAASGKFREMAAEVLANHLGFRDTGPDSTVDMSQLQQQLDQEVADAQQYVAAIVANEQRWIAEGEDVDREFAGVYYDSLDVTIAKAERSAWWTRLGALITACFVPVLLIAAAVTALFLWIRRKRRTLPAGAQPISQ